MATTTISIDTGSIVVTASTVTLTVSGSDSSFSGVDPIFHAGAKKQKARKKKQEKDSLKFVKMFESSDIKGFFSDED